VGEPDPAAWADLAQRWAAVPNPYRAAHARWREAEAVLRSRPDTPRGRVDRAHARRALLQSWETARALGAGPLCRELTRLAARARIPLADGSGPAQAALGDSDTAAPTLPGRETTGSGLALRLAGTPESPPADPFNLSPREKEVLGVLAEGRSNREIAQRLFISERTVAVHVGNILAKLDVAGRVEAATVALRLGLVAVPQPFVRRR
jgi:DNA-binding CsgD family transcriptional regulator